MLGITHTWKGANDRINIAVIGIRGMGQSRIRDYQKPDNVHVEHSQIEDGHYSSALIHLANISYRLGRTLYFDPKTELLTGDEEVQRNAYQALPSALCCT